MEETALSLDARIVLNAIKGDQLEEFSPQEAEQSTARRIRLSRQQIANALNELLSAGIIYAVGPKYRMR